MTLNRPQLSDSTKLIPAAQTEKCLFYSSVDLSIRQVPLAIRLRNPWNTSQTTNFHELDHLSVMKNENSQ